MDIASMRKENGLRTKRAWLKIAALAGVGGALAWVESERERNSLTIAHYTVTSRKLKGDRTLVFLSDLHDCRFGEKQKRLLAAIESVQPDAVLIGGDMMTVKKKAEIRSTCALCRQLTERWPVCYAEGNHEARLFRDRKHYGTLGAELKAALFEMGVILLRDRSALLFRDLRVTGLCITENFYKKCSREQMKKAYLDAHVGQADSGHFQLLLAHSPAFHEAYAAWGADLTLSGHFHGGTICLPGGIGLMTPQIGFFQKNVRGIHERRGKLMIVSPGLGTHSVNVRINNRPQIVAVHLKRAGV